MNWKDKIDKAHKGQTGFFKEMENEQKQESKKKLIELSADLFEKIKRSAQENDRSVNKEINHLLKKSLK